MRHLLALLASLLLSLPLSAPAEVVFSEDWESGGVDPTLWAVREGARSTMRVVDISGDGSDHALLMDPGNPREYWSAALRSRVQFSRAAGSSVTAKLWGEPAIANDGVAYPDGAGWMMGFFRSADVALPPYTQLEAVLDDWHSPSNGNTRLRLTEHPALSVFEGGGGPQVGPIFQNRLNEAVSKETAVTVRVTLGESGGARLDYVSPSGSWATVLDTTGSGSSTLAEPWLGFAPVGAAVYVDDIVVEGEAVFREDWQSGEVALHRWFRKEGLQTVCDVEDVGGGEKALAMWIGPNSEGWSVNVRSRLGFGRTARGTVLEARIWGDPSRAAAPNTYPNGAGWNLGFHKFGIPTAYVFEDCEAVLDNWLTNEFNNQQFTFTEGNKRSVFQGGSTFPRVGTAFTSRMQIATNRASGVPVRITLGEQRGARLEWYDSSLGLWRVEVDTRGQAGGSEPASTVAFGPASAAVFIDDIVVRGAIVAPPGAGQDFPSFEMPGQGPVAETLTRYLAYHFYNRLARDGSNALFNEEYIAVSDLWMGGAKDLLGLVPIQQLHRDKINSMGQQPDGYINTNQHFSHAHEWGWPFPLWVQSTGWGTITAGWHFQDRPLGSLGDILAGSGDTRWYTAAAKNGWSLSNLQDNGVVDGRWRLTSTGTEPRLTIPTSVTIRADNAPFLQLRWTRTGTPPPGVLPYVEWRRTTDSAYSESRRVYFENNGNPAYEAQTGVRHALLKMEGHPEWNGTINRLRIHLAPGETGVDFEVDSFFTVYDTRHTVNMPYYIITASEQFAWTGDVEFLRRNIGQMRRALHFQRDELGGLANNHIRTPWPSHDARPGIVYTNGNKQVRSGVGKGSNYWDLLPFGHDDMYATSLYHKTTLLMADIEEAILANPFWAIPGDGGPLDPAALRAHAADVKATANAKFWNPATGRFVGAIDSEGTPHDYGFTFVNLEAIWHGIADEDRAESIMAWINGDRLVAGDTSQGADIYKWRFGPRATTLRNITWYTWAWSCPECIPFGGQVQDGGAVLGFTFHDLWARLHVLGPDNAFDRLAEIMEWERDVWAEGGYRRYYDVNEGTLQGGGTAGGLGIDFEFFESSMPPAIIPRGFLGLVATPMALRVDPRLPSQCPRMTVRNVAYRGAVMDVTGEDDLVRLEVKQAPASPMTVRFEDDWRRVGTSQVGESFVLQGTGVVEFQRVGAGPSWWMLN